jgi:hypothetical protein
MSMMTQCKNQDYCDAVQYMCNLVFSEHLNVCKNSKFPGTMVVSLSRKELPLISGVRPIHRPYLPCHINAWLKHSNRPIPNLQFDTYTKVKLPLTIVKSANNSVSNMMNLEFGSCDGLFEIPDVCMLLCENIDFGTDDGYFFVSH